MTVNSIVEIGEEDIYVAQLRTKQYVCRLSKDKTNICDTRNYSFDVALNIWQIIDFEQPPQN